jgi:6-phospho-3-hexuloisomerase
MKRSVTEIMRAVLAEQYESLDKIKNLDIESMLSAIDSANKLFVAGLGRSGNVARCFAMRCMHIGLTVYVVGETVTPAILPEDMLLISSGSGETDTLVNIASRAKNIGAKVGLVTIFPESTIAKFADNIIQLPGVTFKSSLQSSAKSIQPHGSLFEQMSFLLFDCMVLALMDMRNSLQTDLFERHANLE